MVPATGAWKCRFAGHVQQQVGFVDQADQAAAVDHRQLGQVGRAHAVEGGQQGVGRRHGDDFAGVEAAPDQVAQVAQLGALQQALVDHPAVAVDLGQVARAGVAHEGDHAFRAWSGRGST
jgi:hypothetical protein